MNNETNTALATNPEAPKTLASVLRDLGEKHGIVMYWNCGEYDNRPMATTVIANTAIKIRVKTMPSLTGITKIEIAIDNNTACTIFSVKWVNKFAYLGATPEEAYDWMVETLRGMSACIRKEIKTYEELIP